MPVPSAFGISALYCLPTIVLMHPDSAMTEGTDNHPEGCLEKSGVRDSKDIEHNGGKSVCQSPALCLNLAKIPVQPTTLLPKSLVHEILCGEEPAKKSFQPS